MIITAYRYTQLAILNLQYKIHDDLKLSDSYQCTISFSDMKDLYPHNSINPHPCKIQKIQMKKKINWVENLRNEGHQ